MNLLKKSVVVGFFLSLILLVAVQSVTIQGFVNDYANIISPEYAQKIEGVLKELYDRNAAEFSVVTIKSLEGTDIESYALELAQGKLGDMEKNNGLLLLVSLQDKQYRFEVGRGLEPILNDAKIGRIGRNYLVGNFRDGNYGKGIYEASLAVQSVIMNDTSSEYNVGDIIPVDIGKLIPFIIIFLVIGLVMVSIIALRIKKISQTKGKDDYFSAALLAAWLFGGKGRGGFGGSGGFGGGGFGWGGGGGFGGGGAGSRW